MTFESDFLFGVDEHGTTVKFSRAERSLLRKFCQNSKAVLTRDDLLDATSEPGSDASDRNIDFIINRLRRKLGDSARNPAFIATQYGEGYVWVAEPTTNSTNTAGAFIVVGPIRGLRHLDGLMTPAQSCAAELRWSLDRKTAKESRVVLDENCPRPEEFVGEKPLFAVELNFLIANGRLDCAVTLKIFATGHIVRVSRHTFVSAGSNEQKIDRKAVDELADKIVAVVWDALLGQPNNQAIPSAEPLAVRMHNASILLSNSSTWLETDRHLQSILDKEPDNHEAQLMLATNLHSKYLTMGPTLFPHQDFRAQDEDEIEKLTLKSLPHIQNNPVLVMAAAKLLYFIDRGQRPLAIQLVEQAFESTTAFATSFAILGQIRMFEGDFESALSLIEQGLDLCGDGTRFELYLLVLKCETLLASRQQKALDAALEVMYAKEPMLRKALCIFYTNPEAPAPEVFQLLDNVNEATARAMLVYSNYICARLFRFAEHRENILRPALTLFVERFGQGVIPEELRESAPALVYALCTDAERPFRAAVLGQAKQVSNWDSAH